MPKRSLTVSLCLLALILCSCAETSLAQTKKSSAKKAAGAEPDKALMQKIWDGWSTLDPANVAQYYATGPRTFFDIAPLKYGSWDEYQAGAKNVLSGFTKGKFTVNDDAAVHAHGDLVWGTATVAFELTSKAGKVDMGNFRWTVIWENIDGKWLTVHEHVSEPIQ